MSTWEFDFFMMLLVADKKCLEMSIEYCGKWTDSDSKGKEQKKEFRWMKIERINFPLLEKLKTTSQ